MTEPTSFQARILNAVRRIPEGRVATYGDVALLAGNPRAARAVGWALRILPGDTDVPWWRVVNREGRISCRSHGMDRQETLLRAEGIQFHGDGLIDLAEYGWFPDSEPLPNRDKAPKSL